jgi:predicted nucleic acid-binding protein
VLVDTSVWVDHLRHGNRVLAQLLEQAEVVTHPFVLGELACGQLRQRELVLSTLAALPQARVATQDEVLHLIDAFRLMGRGLGWVDAHLLASARLERMGLWTLDKRLATAARTCAAG